MKYIDLAFLKNISFEPHDLYHKTNAEIEKLDESFLKKETPWHTNGALGLWCSTFPEEKCHSFGNFCYKILFNNKVRVCKGWIYDDFYKYCCRDKDGPRTREDYIKVRKYLLENGIDLIYIIDSSRSINEVIILNYDCVLKVDKVDFGVNKKFWIRYDND